MKAGSVRIVRGDELNITCEVLTEIENTEKGEDGKRSKTGETRLEWVVKGYYGGRLDWAAESALYLSMPEGEQITPKMIKDAVADIVAATNNHFERKAA